MTFQDVTSALVGTAAAGAVVEESVVVRRAELYRHGLHHAAVSYPARLVRFDAAAHWLSRHKACVTAYSAGEVGSALAVGISPTRITVDLKRRETGPKTGAGTDAGRFVVSTGDHIVALASCTGRRRRVVVDQSADLAALVPVILVHRQIEVIGLHRRINEDGTDPLGIQAIRKAVADMAWLRRSHGLLLTQVCLEGLDPGGSWCEMPRVLRRVTESLYEAAGEACEHHRHPRPMVAVTLAESSLLQQQTVMPPS